jgi:hypothetical protein
MNIFKGVSQMYENIVQHDTGFDPLRTPRHVRIGPDVNRNMFQRPKTCFYDTIGVFHLCLCYCNT